MGAAGSVLIVGKSGVHNRKIKIRTVCLEDGLKNLIQRCVGESFFAHFGGVVGQIAEIPKLV